MNIRKRFSLIILNDEHFWPRQCESISAKILMGLELWTFKPANLSTSMVGWPFLIPYKSGNIAIDYQWLLHWKCTVNLTLQIRFARPNGEIWLGNGQWPTVISSSVMYTWHNGEQWYCSDYVQSKSFVVLILHSRCLQIGTCDTLQLLWKLQWRSYWVDI